MNDNLICMPGDAGYVVPGSPEWRRHIGCSQVSSILGHNQWESANDLWLKITHRAPDTQHRLIFDRGHDMEPKMAKDARAAGRDLKAEQVQYRDPDRPWLIYHADGMFPAWTPLHGDDKPHHGPGVWEAKAPGYNMSMRMEEDGMSSSYIDQTQIGMHVASAAMGQSVTWATFGYLDYDQYKTVMFDCPANAEYQIACLKIIDAFWECVQTDTPPTPIHPNDMPVPPPVKGTKEIITSGPLPALVESLIRLQDNPPNIADFKEYDKLIRAEIKEALGDIQLAEVPGLMRLSYSWGKASERVSDPMGLLGYCERLIALYNDAKTFIRNNDDPLNVHHEPVTFRRSDWVELKAPTRSLRVKRLDEDNG